MRFASVVIVFLAVCQSVRAGIYNTTDGDEMRLSRDVSKFLDTLIKFRSIGLPQVERDFPLRKRYLLIEALGGATPPAALTLEQKLDYSSVLLRRKKFSEAIEFLKPIVRQHPEIFLFDSHLAMAYWGSGQPGMDRRAVEILSQVLSKETWPENFHDLTEKQKEFFEKSMEWNEGEYGRYRKVESYLLKLMKARLADKSGGKIDAIDPLFDDGKKPATPIKFVNADGKYEAGKIASAELKKLPPDALETVEQLSLWLPDDLQLYWLLGEMANANWTQEQLANDKSRNVALGNLDAALRIFNELVYVFQIRANDLRAHRQELSDFRKTVDESPNDTATFDDIDKKIDAALKKDNPGVPMNTQTILITFVTGLAVGIFAIWQYQEFRRRRRGA